MIRFFLAALAFMVVSCNPQHQCLPIPGLETVFERHHVEYWCQSELVQMDLMVVVNNSKVMDGSFTLQPDLKRIRFDRGDGLVGWFDNGRQFATPFPNDPPLEPETLWLWPFIASVPFAVHTKGEKANSAQYTMEYRGITLRDITFDSQGELRSLKVESDEKKIGKKFIWSITFDDYRNGLTLPFATRWEIADQNGEQIGRVLYKDLRSIHQGLSPHIFDQPPAVERIN